LLQSWCCAIRKLRGLFHLSETAQQGKFPGKVALKNIFGRQPRKTVVSNYRWGGSWLEHLHKPAQQTAELLE
jgi:hypothetical protein